MQDDRSREPRKQYQGYIDLFREDPDKPARITPGLIDYMIHTVGPKFGAFHDQCRMAYRYYQLENTIETPQGVQSITLPTFRDRVNTAVAQISAGYADIMVPPRRITSGGTAEKMEKFLHRAHAMMERQNPVDETMLIDMCLYGVAFIKVHFDIDKMYELPELPPLTGNRSDRKRTAKGYTEAVDQVLDMQSGRFPVTATNIEPTEMIWDLSSPNPKWMIWKTRRPMSLVQAYFPDWGRDDEAGEEYIDFYEVWTKDQVAFWCDDRYAMEPRSHEYGMIPILMTTPAVSKWNEAKRPEDRFRGLGHGVYDLIEMESRMAATYLAIAEKSASPYWEVHGPSGLARQVMETFSQQPNAMNHIPPGADVVRGEVGEAPRSLLEGRQMLQDAIQTSIFTSVAARRPENGPSSGYQTAVLQGIASLNLTPIMLAYKRIFEKRNELVLRTVEHVIRQTVPVGGVGHDGASVISLSPNDIGGYYSNIVELNAMSPDEQERKARLWSEMYQAGWVDHRYSLTQGGVQHPHEVMLAVEMERLRASDPYQMQLLQLMMARMPYLQQLLQAVGEDNLAQEVGAQESAVADSILAAQSGPAADGGQFTAGNQAGTTPATPGSGTPGTVRPKRPGSFEEADLAARQLQNIPGGRV